jgi:putative DNA primase/helicase
MRGSRLVTATETEQGRRWAESRIKQMTGGDPVAARFMRQDFFTYLPQFKLFVVGQRKPSLRRVDEAMRRRLHLIPFTVTIPEEEQDKELTEKLKAEWPGILAWMIEGCLEWQEQGLRKPEAVLKATGAYSASEDLIAQWRDECCTPDPMAWTSSADLYASWSAYAEAAGEHPVRRRPSGLPSKKRGSPSPTRNRRRAVDFTACAYPTRILAKRVIARSFDVV